MCRMTELGLRAISSLSRAGTYLVARGNLTGLDLYISDNGDDLSAFKPIYRLRVKAKRTAK